MNHKRNVLTIAGSDSSGGAGIQADIKTFEALNVYSACVISAVTSQNTLGVQSVYELPTSVLESQLKAVLADIEFSAIKIGMLKSKEHIEVVARLLKRYMPPNIVVDPVMISSSGFRLQDEAATQILIDELFPLTRLITPNIPEAAYLLKCEPDWVSHHAAEACKLLIENFSLNAVLLKGGHTEKNYCIDMLACKNSDNPDLVFTSYHYQKLAKTNTHGTGCTLASAIAACLAKGYELRSAVDTAGKFLQLALKNADYQMVGKGIGPLNHHDAAAT